MSFIEMVRNDNRLRLASIITYINKRLLEIMRSSIPTNEPECEEFRSSVAASDADLDSLVRDRLCTLARTYLKDHHLEPHSRVDLRTDSGFENALVYYLANLSFPTTPADKHHPITLLPKSGAENP